MRLSALLLLCILPFSLAQQGTPIGSKISGYFIVFFLLFLAVLIKGLVLYCRARTSSNGNGHVGRVEMITVSSPSPSSSAGVDKGLINSLPVFEFALLRDSRVGSECAVCLGRFEDTDLLHLLPKCRHAFHRECIDKWLEDHSSCPICRQSVDAEDISAFGCTKSCGGENAKEEGVDGKRLHDFDYRITVPDANFGSLQ